jgi:nucleoside-diphosphate-sugar epimerase
MKVIITGSTGMVGRSALNECLLSENVEEVLMINRRSLGVTHPKLKELVHTDFTDFSSVVDKLNGYDACFHCMGVSSVGKKEGAFTKLTYDVTKSLADACYDANPNMVFNYVSGAGTDSTEKGKVMWSRVKGKTENYILNKGFKDAYMFRLGALVAENGIKSSTKIYRILYIVMTPFFTLLKRMKSVTTSRKFGNAMINSVLKPKATKYLDNQAINALAIN